MEVSKIFVAHFRATFPGENIPIKMHMLEDHAVDWIRSNQHIGFGLMGEQGAESIHARFNRHTKLTARSPQPVIQWRSLINTL